MEVDIIHNEHVLDALKEIPDDCIDTIVTSPPYFGLRDYGEDTKTIWGGDKDCKHQWELNTKKDPMDRGGTGTHDAPRDRKGVKHGKKWEMKGFTSGFCQKCGAWYGQLGLEPTLEMYIEHLLQITKELKRVLKPTGVMFWNHGDCYGSSPPGNSRENIEQWANKGDGLIGRKFNRYGDFKKPQGVKQKSLALQNFRLILKMVDEQGWILRNIIIWYKPNGMPSSVKDRMANKYEPVFMLTKRRKYWFDLDAVRVPHKPESIERAKKGWHGNLCKGHTMSGIKDKDIMGTCHPLGKNPGDVWTIPTQPFPEAHFATFPEKLVEPMIRCACPKWICKKCGKARVRVTRVEYEGGVPLSGKELTYTDNNFSTRKFKGARGKWFTIGWTDCGCNAGFDTGIVLDPFAGAGTTLVVAKRLRRHYIGIEIKAKYVEIAEKRLGDVVYQEEFVF